MADNYFIACDGILGIKTNLKRFKWSFGAATPPGTQADFERCLVRPTVQVEPDVEPPHGLLDGKYHYFQSSHDRDEIYYDRRFLFGSRLRLHATGLQSDTPVIRVNRTYYQWVSHRFMNLHSLGYIMTDLASLLLLRRGFCPIHCSALQIGDATVVVLAPPNTGKTLTAVAACLDHGAAFLAEDLAVTDGDKVYAVPWTSTFRYYRRFERRWMTRVRNRFTEWIPPLELLATRQPQPITDFIDPKRVSFQGDVTHVVILERGEPEVRDVAVDEATRLIQNLNRYEFNYHKAPLIVAAEFFQPDLDIVGMCRRERELLRRLAGSARCLRVTATDASTYVDAIMDAVGTGRVPQARLVAA